MPEAWTYAQLVEELSERDAEQARVIAAQDARIVELERRLGQDSWNLSHPHMFLNLTSFIRRFADKRVVLGPFFASNSDRKDDVPCRAARYRAPLAVDSFAFRRVTDLLK
jgi:hypothetical protein